MNWDTVVVAGIAAVSPVVMLYYTNRGLRLKQEEDWKRQDLVAERLAYSNKKVADTAAMVGKSVVGKLDIIHTLVNSTLTEAVIKAKVKTALYIEELERDPNPSAAKLEIIAATKLELAEMEAQLADRAKQAAVVAAQERGLPKE